ncbi:MAG: hypothetical protein GY845_27480 [Planctomycetes bacterium]|nr:hypothetical protein [Planctomycetota bacterium]
MYRESSQSKFSKATLARLWSFMLLVVFAVPHLKAVAEEVTYSKLWGHSGELWSPTSRLHSRNLYEFQIRRRQQNKVLSQRNH